jgi:cytochrome c7-like protein
VAKRVTNRATGAIVFAVTCLLIVGSYVGVLSADVEPSLAKPPAQFRPRSFPHDQKEHRKVECAACHLGAKDKPARTDQPMARDFPHATCVRCHNFAAEFFKVALGGQSKFCTVCHENRRISKADKALRQGVLTPTDSTDFDDAFSHKAHRKVLPPDLTIRPVTTPQYGSQFLAGTAPRCTDCHLEIRRAPEREKDMQTESSHPTCFVCHGGTPPETRRVTADTFPYASDCKVCHELRVNPGAPRAQMLFGNIKGFRHLDHDLDIRPKKRSDFPLPTATDYLCSQCHAPIEQAEALTRITLPEVSYCNQCHINNRPGLPARLEDEVLNKLRK